jgi:hypothetical protein
VAVIVDVDGAEIGGSLGELFDGHGHGSDNLIVIGAEGAKARPAVDGIDHAHGIVHVQVHGHDHGADHVDVNDHVDGHAASRFVTKPGNDLLAGPADPHRDVLVEARRW